jgi:hypothetical protein
VPEHLRNCVPTNDEIAKALYLKPLGADGRRAVRGRPGPSSPPAAADARDALASPLATRRPSRSWAAFADPGIGWLLAFFVVSVYAVMAVAFGDVDPFLKTAIPAWNPLEWDVTG